MHYGEIQADEIWQAVTEGAKVCIVVFDDTAENFKRGIYYSDELTIVELIKMTCQTNVKIYKKMF